MWASNPRHERDQSHHELVEMQSRPQSPTGGLEGDMLPGQFVEQFSAPAQQGHRVSATVAPSPYEEAEGDVAVAEDEEGDPPPTRKRRLNSSVTAEGRSETADNPTGDVVEKGRASWAAGDETTSQPQAASSSFLPMGHNTMEYNNPATKTEGADATTHEARHVQQYSQPMEAVEGGLDVGGRGPTGHPPAAAASSSSSPASSTSNVNHPVANHSSNGSSQSAVVESSENLQSRTTTSSLKARNLMSQLAAAENFDVSQFDPSVWNILAAAVEYKVRTLVDESIRVVKRQPKRGTHAVLNSASVQLAAQLLGFESPLTPCQAAIRSEYPARIDDILNEFEDVMPPPIPFLRVQWTTINGRTVVDPEIMQSTQSRAELSHPWRYMDVPTFKKEFVDLESATSTGYGFGVSLLFSTQLGQSEGISKERAYDAEEAEVLCVPRGLEYSISEEQKLYMDRLCGAMRAGAHGDALQKMTLEKIVRSLATGRFPPKLIPFLVSLTCREMARALPIQDPEALMVVIQVTQSLISNPHISLSAYLHQILNLLFTALLSPLPGGNTMDAVHRAVSVRGMVAELLARVVSMVTSGTSTVSALTTVMDLLSATLAQLHLPLPTLIGALMGARCLGPTCLHQIVTPSVMKDLSDTVRRSLLDLNKEKQLGGVTLHTEVKEFLKTILLDLLLSDRRP